MLDFKPLNLSMIEQGNFLRDVNKEFVRIQKEHCKYAQQHKTQADGSVSEITISVKLKCVDFDNNVFAVGTSVKHKLPTRPSKITTALMTQKNDDEEMCLWGQVAGTHVGNPAQGQLMTEDGRAIDQVTGEAEVPETDEDGVIINELDTQLNTKGDE